MSQKLTPIIRGTYMYSITLSVYDHDMLLNPGIELEARMS